MKSMPGRLYLRLSCLAEKPSSCDLGCKNERARGLRRRAPWCVVQMGLRSRHAPAQVEPVGPQIRSSVLLGDDWTDSTRPTTLVNHERTSQQYM